MIVWLKFEKGMKYDIFRQYLLENTIILEIQNKGDKVFEEVQMPASIVRFQKRKVQVKNGFAMITISYQRWN